MAAISTGTALLVAGAASAGAAVYGANQASNAAEKARRDRLSAEERRMEDLQNRREEWDAVYGGLEENLAEYYQSLNADDIAAQGIEEYERERNVALTRAREKLAQRGISDSGIAAGIELNSELQGATARAEIRRKAPAEVAKQQQSFLQFGLQTNPDASIDSALAQSTQYAYQDQQAANQAAANAAEQAATAVGGAIDTAIDYFSEPDGA